MNITLANKLNEENIEKNIQTYINSLKEMDLNISENNILDFFKKLKRASLNKGPYHGITLFEASNRIMTDLVILFGVKDLLTGKYKNINFPEYIVEYGNENNNEHDIIAKNSGKELIGEAFNVAPSFFQGKKGSSLKKMRKNNGKDIIKILMYNMDAVDKNYIPEENINEYHIRVNIECGNFT